MKVCLCSGVCSSVSTFPCLYSCLFCLSQSPLHHAPSLIHVSHRLVAHSRSVVWQAPRPLVLACPTTLDSRLTADPSALSTLSARVIERAGTSAARTHVPARVDITLIVAWSTTQPFALVRKGLLVILLQFVNQLPPPVRNILNN